MVFKSGGGAAPAPTPPAPPPNPPMFGSQAVKKKGAGGTPQTFDASAIGTLPAAAAAGQKSLIGQ